MLGQQMKLLQVGGANGIGTAQAQNNFNMLSSGGIKAGLTNQGSALIVSQKSGGAPILMPLASNVNSAKVLSSRQTVVPSKQHTTHLDHKVSSGFGTVNNHPIVVKDGERNHNRTIEDDIKADIGETIQSINQNRPQTTVQLGEKLLSESAPRIEETHSNLTQEAPMKAVATTQRDTRQQSQMNENKSYTQMLSEGSREDNLVLKPSNILAEQQKQFSGVADINATPPLHLNTSQIHNASPTFHNTTIINQTAIAQHASSSIDNPSMIPPATASAFGTASEPTRPATMANQSQVIQQREMIEAQSAAAYGMISGSQSGAIGGGSQQNRRRQLLSIDSNNPNKKKMFSDDEESMSPANHNNRIVSGGLATLSGSAERGQIIPQAESNMEIKDPSIGHPSMVTLLQRQKQEPQQQQVQDPHQVALSKQGTVRYGSAPAFSDNLIIKRCEMTQKPNLLLQLEAKKSKKRRDILLAQLNSEKLGAASSTGFESRLHTNHHRHTHDQHGACQRFLDRGNKPVPPNYEEHDVLPPQVSTAVNHGFSNPALQGAVVNVNQARKGKQLNMDEFDEEISGVNLSKLFSAYGPVTQTTGGARIHPNVQMNNSAIDDPNNLDEDDDEDDPDFSSFDEPIVVRLMTNMFNQKKSVQEGLQMLPEIPLDKIRRELDYLRAQERARAEKERRDVNTMERHRTAERFIRKLEGMRIKLEGESQRKEELMEFGHELSELRQNPFFLALKDNKVERERLEKIKELQMLMYQEQQARLNQIYAIENGQQPPQKQENAAFDIFKHTFVDAENLQAVDEEIELSNNNMGVSVYNHVQRERKEVFTYYDLTVELPQVLFEHLGDYSVATERQKGIMKAFLHQHFPEMQQKKLNYKYAYHFEKRVFHLLVTGACQKNQPWSKCCKIAVCFQFDRDIGCKVLCMEPLCPYNPLDQFFQASTQDIEDLFRETDLLTHSEQSTDHQIAPDLQHPRLRKIMAQEVSRSISKGMHKNGKSIRELLLKSNSLNEAYGVIQGRQMRQEQFMPQQYMDYIMPIKEEVGAEGGSIAYNQMAMDDEEEFAVEEGGAYNVEQSHLIMPAAADEALVNF